MDEKKRKWKTWWWYHKIHVLIAAVTIAVGLYSVLPGLLTPKPDYSAAVISVEWIPEETLALLRERISQAADDANGDGRVLVEVQLFQADLSGNTEGTINYSEAARLDANLVGKVSSVFLIDNPAGFHANTAVAVEPEVRCDELPFFKDLTLPDGMTFTVRTDSDAQNLYQAILDYR